MLIDVALEFANQLRILLPDRPDLLRACNDSSRRQLVLSNLCAEVLKFEKKFGKLADRRRRDYLIGEVAKIFVNSVIIEHRNKKIIVPKSPLEELEHRASQAKDFLGDSLIENGAKVNTLGK